jgi:hypothetical protein
VSTKYIYSTRARHGSRIFLDDLDTIVSVRTVSSTLDMANVFIETHNRAPAYPKIQYEFLLGGDFTNVPEYAEYLGTVNSEYSFIHVYIRRVDEQEN